MFNRIAVGVLGFVVAMLLFVIFDHAMRVDALMHCNQWQDVSCPAGPWLWSKPRL